MPRRDQRSCRRSGCAQPRHGRARRSAARRPRPLRAAAERRTGPRHRRDHARPSPPLPGPPRSDGGIRSTGLAQTSTCRLNAGHLAARACSATAAAASPRAGPPDQHFPGVAPAWPCSLGPAGRGNRVFQSAWAARRSPPAPPGPRSRSLLAPGAVAGPRPEHQQPGLPSSDGPGRRRPCRVPARPRSSSSAMQFVGMPPRSHRRGGRGKGHARIAVVREPRHRRPCCGS